MSKFAYSMSDSEAVLAFKKGFMGVGVGNVAILKDKGNAFVLGAPMMEVDVRFEKGVVSTSARGMGKTLLGTVDTKIELIEGFRKITDEEAKALQSSAAPQFAAPAGSASASSGSAVPPSLKESVSTSSSETGFTKGRSVGLIVVLSFTLFFLLFNAMRNFPRGSGGFYAAYLVLYILCVVASVGFCITDIVFAARKKRNMTVFAIGMMVKVIALLCTGLESSYNYLPNGTPYMDYSSFYFMEYCYLLFSVLFNSGLLFLYSMLFLTIKEDPVVKTITVEAPMTNPSPSAQMPSSQEACAPSSASETVKEKDEPIDVAESLKKYKALKDEGLIDEDMYKEKAKKLLGL